MDLIVKDIISLRNILCHNRNTDVSRFMEETVFAQDDTIRELLNSYGVDMQNKNKDELDGDANSSDSTNAPPFLAAIKMAGD